VRDLRSTRRRGTERRAERRQKGKLKIGVDIPTREEIKAIVGAAQGRWRPVLLTAIFTGLRAVAPEMPIGDKAVVPLDGALWRAKRLAEAAR